MTKNAALKIALFKANMTQRELAKITRIPEASISLAINGRLIFTNEQIERTAKALKVKAEEIFYEANHGTDA
jgi:transcriptional regulator with XRE-family HTH domain